ncbi:hypothetical protein ACFXJO_40510 [Streptomyces lavendulae]|uniref:hypothetical protein n=1 Tax=Streptomyces lavendulae TaxID=1914 RepID=UPI00367B3FA8
MVLDPEEEWAVSPDGLLAYTVREPEAVAYGLEGAFAAVHRGADLLDALALSEGERAAVSLAVSAVLTSLEQPGCTLADVISTCYDSTPEELSARFGWEASAPGGGSAEPEEEEGGWCPRCGADARRTCRQWAVCTNEFCTWGGMEWEMAGLPLSVK